MTIPIGVQFLLSATIMVLAASKLAVYGDALGVRTRLGGLFIGTLLMAGATSLPELLTGINSARQGAPNLSAGDLFGSNMLNMMLLGVLDLAFWRVRVLRQVALKHVLSAGVAILMTLSAVFLLMAQIDVRIGWVGLDSLILIGLYVVGVWLIQRDSADAACPVSDAEENLEGVPTLPHAVIGFAAMAGVLLMVSPWLVRSAVGLAEISGLSTGFVGAALVGVATSLPELITTIAAVRIGAYDMAVGNLFGSNIFNMAALGITDVLYTQGHFLGSINPQLGIIGIISLILMALALVGNATRVRHRRLIIEADSAAIFVVYFIGLYFLYSRGIGH
jgi:cation:H+ antiporter